MVLKIIIALALFLIPSPPTSGAKTIGAKKDYTKQQKIHRGEVKQKKYTTCRLAKRIRSKTTGQQACIYRGGNRTFELMYEKDCPKQYKCIYNPGQPEPNIDSVIDSLNQIKK